MSPLTRPFLGMFTAVAQPRVINVVAYNDPLVIYNEIGRQNHCSGPYFDCCNPKVSQNRDGPIDSANSNDEH